MADWIPDAKSDWVPDKQSDWVPDATSIAKEDTPTDVPLTKKLFPNMPSGGNVSTWTQGAFEAAPAIGSAFMSFPLGLAEGAGAAAGGASLAEATEEMGKSMDTYTYKPQTPEAKYIYDNAMKAAGYILEPVSEVARSIGQMVSTSPYGKVARDIGVPKGATEFLPEQAAFLKLLGKGHAAKKVLSDYYTPPIKIGKVPTTVDTIPPVTEKVRRRPSKIVPSIDEAQKIRQQQLAERNKDLFQLSKESTEGDTPIVIEDNVPGADLELERQKAIVEGQAEAAGWRAAGVVEPTKVELTGEEAIKLAEEPAKEIKKKGVVLSPEDSALLMDEYGIEGKTHEEVMKLGNEVSAKVAGKGGMDVLDKLTDDEVASLSYRDMVMTPKSARDRQMAAIRSGTKPIDTLTPEKYAKAQDFNKKLEPAIQAALVKQNEKVSRSHDVRKTSPDIDDLASEKKVETIEAMSELDRKARTVADRMRNNEDIPDAELDALVLEISKAVEADKTGDTADIFDPLTAYPAAESVMENLPLEEWLKRRKTIEKAAELRRVQEKKIAAEAKKAIPKTDAELKKEAAAKRRRDRAALKQLEKESEEAYDLEKREALEEIEGVLDTQEGQTDYILRRTAADKAAVKKMKEMSADDYEAMLEAEGLPAELNFNESLMRDVGGDIKEAYARAVKWIMNDRKASGEAKKAALSYLSSITGRRPKTIVPGALKNAMVDAYKYMPETATEARAWLDKVIIPLEEKYMDNKGTKRIAYSRKSIADAVDRKIITKDEAAICRIVLDTLKEQPTFELSWDAKMEGKSGLYSFVDNLMTLKNAQALAHEIGHYAKHNVISGADRVKFYEDFIDKYYKDNKIQYSRIMDATTDPYNARRNPAEFFASRFSDYLSDKVLSPTEKNLFLKVVDWGKKLLAALTKKTGRDYSGVDKIFDKIVDRVGGRKTWPGVEEGIAEGPLSTRTESMLKIVPKDEVVPEVVAKGQTIREQRDEWLRNRAGEARRLRGEAEQAVTSMREEQREAYGKGEYESEDKWQGSRAFLERFKDTMSNVRERSTENYPGNSKYPRHGTDIEELKGILKSGLRAGSALDLTREGSWAEASPVTIEVPSAKPGKKIEHNNYYQSANDAMPTKVTIDLSQYNHPETADIKSSILEMAKENPSVRFEILNDPGPYTPKYTVDDLTALYDKSIEIMQNPNPKIAELKAEKDNIKKPFEYAPRSYRNISREVKAREAEIDEDIKWYEREDRKALERVNKQIRNAERDVEIGEKLPKGTFTLDMFGLQTISERLTKMLSDHRKANKITKGQQILAEIQGEGWGESERPTINVKGVPESSWDKFKDTWKDWLSSPDITAGKGTINDALVYDIRRASMYTAFKVAQHRATIMDAKKGIAGKSHLENRVRVTDYLRKKQRGESVDDMVLSEVELESAAKIREWLDVMRDRYKLYQKTEYSKHLGKTEYNAFLDLEAGYPLDHVKAKYPKISTSTIEGIYDKYEAINNWGIDDYITNVERGNYRLLVDATTTDGKPYKKLVGVALSEKDGIRKAYEYVKNNPDFSGDMYIDMNMPYGDDLTKVTTKQYHTMKNKLKDSLMKEMEGIEKGVAAKIASAAMKRRFKMTPTDVFNQFILDRSDILKGEPDIFDILSSYAYHMEKKMALDPAIDKVRLSLNKMTPKEREFILPYLERVKGSYGPFEKMADGLLSFTGMHRPFGRSTAALRNYQAMSKLGYRPIAAGVNLASGQMHTHVKVGAKYMEKGRSFLETPEGVQFLREVEPYLGTSILETDTSIKAKTPMYHPLGMFQSAEPFNRRMCAAANYQYAVSPKIEGGLGLSPDAAMHHAIRQNWFQQFTYDVASLPKAISSPLGRTIGQFKPYLVKEIEFIASLKPKEFARYAAWNMALAGPRGLLLTIRTLPILAAMGWWQGYMDDAEEWLLKNAPNVARGLPGLPGAPEEIGIDVSGPATFQMPDDMTDLLGVTYSTLSKVYKDILVPMMAHEYAEDMKKKGGTEEIVRTASEAVMRFAKHEAPAFNHLMRAIDYAIDTGKDGTAYLKDDKGNRLYEIKDAFPYIVQSVAGTESVDISNIRNMVSIAIRRASRDESVEGQIRLEALREQLAGRPLSDALIAKINKYDINVSSIVDKNIMALLPPGDRQALKTKLRRRGEVLEMFQGLNDDLDDAVSLP